MPQVPYLQTAMTVPSLKVYCKGLHERTNVKPIVEYGAYRKDSVNGISIIIIIFNPKKQTISEHTVPNFPLKFLQARRPQ